jgi:hypothetical protein
MYLMYKDTDVSKAEQYANTLRTKHPNSTFAKTLDNPNYMQESNMATEKQKELYKEAYESYVEHDYTKATQLIKEAHAIGVSIFTPTLQLLEILIVGKTEDISKYQYQLGEFMKVNTGTDLGAYAQKLLDASRQVQDAKTLRVGVQYIRSLNEPHYFVMVYSNAEKLGNMPTLTLEKFNMDNFRDLKLKTSNMLFNPENTMTLVDELPRVSSAIEYVKTFNEKLATLTELRNHKFHSFVITKDNFDILYRTKGLDEYLQFFEKNYPKETE